MKILDIIIVLILVAATMALMYFAGMWQGQRSSLDIGGHIEPREAINQLETAKEIHEYWAAHEDEAPWVIRVGQDAEWVEIYGEIIELLEVLEERRR